MEPLGKQINLGGKDTGMIKPYTIVGVLGDQVGKSVGGCVEPTVLLPQQQIPTTSLFYQALLKTVVTFVVKTHGTFRWRRRCARFSSQSAPGFALDSSKPCGAVDEEYIQPAAWVVSCGLVRGTGSGDGDCWIVRSAVATGELPAERNRGSHGAGGNAA